MTTSGTPPRPCLQRSKVATEKIIASHSKRRHGVASRLHKQCRSRLSRTASFTSSSIISTDTRRTNAGSRNTPTRVPFHSDTVVVAQSGRNLVFDPAAPVTQRGLVHRRRAIAEAHRCFHHRLQRDCRAIRLDQEKGLPATVQESPYRSAPIPGISD